MTPTSNRRGIVAMLAAVALFAFMDAGLKLLAPHYPALQVAALRGLVALPLIVIWVGFAGGYGQLVRVRWSLHLLRGVLSIGMLGGFAYALKTLPLANAYAVFFVAPLMIAALSAPLLGERVGRASWIAIAVGFAGVLVVLRPTGEGFASWAGLAVLGAATGYALSSIAVRLLGRTDSTASMVFWMTAMVAVGAGVLAAPGWVPVRAEHYGVLALIAVTGALGQYAVTEAFKRGEAGVVAPLEYTALAWGVGLDLALWHTRPDALTLVGGAIIIASGIYLIRGTRGGAH